MQGVSDFRQSARLFFRCGKVLRSAASIVSFCLTSPARPKVFFGASVRARTRTRGVKKNIVFKAHMFYILVYGISNYKQTAWKGYL